MKLNRMLFIAAFSLLQISIHGQLEYETTVEDEYHSFILDKGEKIYASYHKADKKVVLYNEDHSEWKSVYLPIPRNLYFDELKSLSVHVFNTDELIELAYTCVEYIPNNETEGTTEHVDIRHSLYIINEEGSIVLEAENSNRMEIVDNSGSRKLWVYKQRGKDVNMKEHVEVYSLPDAPLNDIQTKQSDQSDFRAFGDRHGF